MVAQSGFAQWSPQPRESGNCAVKRRLQRFLELDLSS
jgi:hypothetical protein